MPIKRFPESLTSQAKEELRNRLEKEFREPQQSREVAAPFVEAPLILFHRSKPLKRIHLTVVWDVPAWKELDLGSRCEIVMRAFAEAYQDRAAEVSSSLGTTSEEADDFDLDLEAILREGEDVGIEDLAHDLA